MKALKNDIDLKEYDGDEDSANQCDYKVTYLLNHLLAVRIDHHSNG